MTSKRQLTLHLDPDIVRVLDLEASRRGLTLSRAANDALRRALIDEAGEGLATTVKSRLDRMEKRDHARARDVVEIKEALLLFVRFWFERAGPIEDDDPDAEADAKARYEAFLEMLARELER